MSKRILLTGAGGLVGEPAIEMLRQHGHEVVTIGRRCENSISGVDLAVGALADILESKYDLVVHLAAQIPGKGENVELMNQQIDDNVFQFAADLDIPLIYASSGSVYGSTYREAEMSENLVCHPELDYSKQKLRSEEWLRKNLREHYICRITAPYGPSERYQGVLGIFCRKAVAGENIILYGSGLRRQDFIHVRDIAELFCAIAASEQALPGVYNVSAGAPVTMKTTAEKVLNATGGSSTVEFAGIEDPQENFRANYSVEKAKQDFGWKATISLDEGIRELIGKIRDESSNNI